MPVYLPLFILIPLFGFLVGVCFPKRMERAISLTAIITALTHLVFLLGFSAFWITQQHPVLDNKFFVFFKAKDIEIFLDFYFDLVTLVFSGVGSFIMLLVAVFSRFYLHREEGFKRYFTTLLLFFLGYNLIIFSGNYETFFIGWEFLGITSFLLIAFYRERYLPVRNALKVISVYRLGDVLLILALWMSHHTWHENITFSKLNNAAVVAEHLQRYYQPAIFTMIMVLLAAAVKSAQFPFSSWLPRAMEGPTTSSAIFYGALSTHVGVFILLRTYPYWENIDAIRILIATIGAATVAVTVVITRVQATVKTQIAYSSITQIGLIFIEIAVGFHTLALVHFAGNALLRTYQLLVSPAVLSYLVHTQFYHFTPGESSVNTGGRFNKWKQTIYLLGIKEWNLDFFQYRYLWAPFKWIGKKSAWFSPKTVFAFGLILFISGLIFYFFRSQVHVKIVEISSVLMAFTGMLFILKAFSSSKNADLAWNSVMTGQLFILLSVVLANSEFSLAYLVLCLSGSLISAVVGAICIRRIKQLDNDIILNRYHGYVLEKPVLSVLFLLSCLGFAGFPITPTFIGIDLLFNHIHTSQLLSITFISIGFLFTELALLRIYARIFLGQHKKLNHAIAYRSS